MTRLIRPTIKQKKAVEKIVENGGNISKAMIEAGYSPATAHTPQKLTESKGFQQLCEQYLPDNMLLEALSEDIKTKKRNRKPELELAFKVKGRLSEDKSINQQNLVIVIPQEIADKNELNPLNPLNSSSKPNS